MRFSWDMGVYVGFIQGEEGRREALNCLPGKPFGKLVEKII
jgi:hypothetical protein